MDEPTLHVASGLNLWRAVKYPEVTDFSFFLDEDPEVLFMDIHDTTAEYKAKQAKYPPIYVTSHRGVTPSQRDNIYLSQFFSVSDHGRSFWAHPAHWLQGFTRDRTFTGGGIKIIHHGGDHTGWSLVTFDESQIIGGSWLAYVRTETVPTP